MSFDLSFEKEDPAETLLRQTLERWPRTVAIFTSFQAEGMVLLDMAWRIDPGVRVVTLDTGRLPQETYDMIERVRERYSIEIEVHFPQAHAVEGLLRRRGPNLFYESVEARLDCCRVRKVEPLRRALRGLDAWITGLRRGQSGERAAVEKVSVDAENGGILKLCPLADWSWNEVMGYTRAHGVPLHTLYARGYTSIGCAPCTRPTGPGEDPRAGRWWWELGGKRECGLHLPASGGGDALVTIGGS